MFRKLRRSKDVKEPEDTLDVNEAICYAKSVCARHDDTMTAVIMDVLRDNRDNKPPPPTRGVRHASG